MLRAPLVPHAILLGLAFLMSTPAPGAERPAWALAIHGGAGDLPKDLPPAEILEIQNALQQSLDAGSAILSAGGPALEAVQAAVRVMEHSGVLNAGRGAVLNHEGLAELDAALMDGRDRRVGAVAAVRHVASPIDLARAVMEHSTHVLLVGSGAESFAKEQGLQLMPDSYFITERRRRELDRALETARRDHPVERGAYPQGTVGAVALDRHGNLAAATSTGGTTNKHVGRVGDTPLIGAGTYAENGVCAVSATGHGEFFIRYTAAGEVCARVKYQKKSIDVAAREVIAQIKAAGGEGGLIAVDRNGRIALPYSSATMVRGRITSEAPPEVIVEVPKG
jgi:beta-aspartyl-peptidase (threonine type)